MENSDKFFIAVYTCHAKRYCDDVFFRRLGEIAGESYISIVDNSQNTEYIFKLIHLAKKYLKNYNIAHLNIEPGSRIFLRSVGDSVKFLQKEFLLSDKQFFITLETDIIPLKDDLLETFYLIRNVADIIGGIYYQPLHHPDEWFESGHAEFLDSAVFSGCTMYNRHVLTQLQFRYDLNNPGVFPDSFMHIDAKAKNFRSILYTGIKCKHIHKDNGSRGHEEVKDD